MAALRSISEAKINGSPGSSRDMLGGRIGSDEKAKV
jgi:hypothetical protein